MSACVVAVRRHSNTAASAAQLLSSATCHVFHFFQTSNIKSELYSLLVNGHLSLHFNSHFPGEPGLAGVIEAKDDGSGGDNWSYKPCKAPVITTNKPTPTFFTGRMPFLSPNQQCQSTEGKS